MRARARGHYSGTRHARAPCCTEAHLLLALCPAASPPRSARHAHALRQQHGRTTSAHLDLGAAIVRRGTPLPMQRHGFAFQSHQRERGCRARRRCDAPTRLLNVRSRAMCSLLARAAQLGNAASAAALSGATFTACWPTPLHGRKVARPTRPWPIGAHQLTHAWTRVLGRGPADVSRAVAPWKLLKCARTARRAATPDLSAARQILLRDLLFDLRRSRTSTQVGCFGPLITCWFR